MSTSQSDALNPEYQRAVSQGRALARLVACRSQIEQAVDETPAGPARELLTLIPILIDAAGYAVGGNDAEAKALLRTLGNVDDVEGVSDTAQPTQADSAFVEGLRYRLTLKTPTMRKPQDWVLDYVGVNDGKYVFSGRPVAGTQTIPFDWVQAATVVHHSTPIKLGR